MIAFLTPSLDPAHPTLGFASSWAKALAQRAGAVRVLTREGTALIDAPEIDVRVAFPAGHRSEQSSLWRRWQWLCFLRRELRGIDTALVHMVPRDAIWARRLGKQSMRLGLWYAHGSLGPGLKRAIEASQAVFTPDVRSCPIRAPHVQYIGHGIDLEHFATPRSNPNAEAPLLFAARISVRKEPLFAIEVWRAWRRITRGALRPLHVVGAALTAADRALEQMVAAKTALDPEVVLRGAVPWSSMPDCYAQAALLIAPSTTGSLDKNVLEAHACGLPVVVRADSGASEQVAEVDPEAVCATDEPRDWAAVIEQLLTLPAAEQQRRRVLRREGVLRKHDLHRRMELMVRELVRE